MARGVNKVILIGNLGQDPDLRTTQNQKQVVNMSIATSEQWTDKNTGQKQERTEWHRVVLFDGLAGIAASYLKKGSKVYIEGKLQTRKWQNQQGVDQYTTEIVASELQMLDGRGGDGGSGGGQNYGGGYDYNQAPSPQQGGYQQPVQQPYAAPAPQPAQAPHQGYAAPAPQPARQPAPQPQMQPPPVQQPYAAPVQPAAQPHPSQAPQQHQQPVHPRPAAPPVQQPQQPPTQPSGAFGEFDDEIPF